MSGRRATTDIRPGQFALSVGMPIKEAPKGWKWVSLNKVATMATGHTPSRRKPQYWGGEIPWVSVKDARPYHGKKIFQTTENINELGIKNSAAVLLPPDTVCLSRTGSIGYSIMLGVEMATSQGFVNWICEDQLDPRFLQLLFIAEKRFLHTISEGVAHTTIYFPEAKAFHICLPHISTQQAIVSKIEELFSELDKGIEQLKTAQQQLKTYRQAVLQWAFEGKFTNENVKDGELPKGWEWVKFGDINEVKSNLVNALDHQDAPHIAPDNISKGTARLLAYKTIQEDKVFSPKHKFYKGQILYSKIRPNLAKVIIAPINGLCSADMYPIESTLENKFTLYYMLTNYFVSQASNTESRTVLPKINQKGLNAIPFPLCSRAEQILIVQAIESRLSVADKMEETIVQSIQQAQFLRQSILKTAFEGRLTATDTIETIQEANKVIPLERKILAGKLIFLHHQDKKIGLTKFQKLLYLVENFSEMTYITNYTQETAGPYDRSFTLSFRKEMQKKKWIQEEAKGKSIKLIPAENINSLTKEYAVYFGDKNDSIDFVLQQLKDKSTHDAELIATLYAVWNNRLIKKKPIKIDALIEDFFNWSTKKKEEFQQEEIVTTYNWMKKIKLVPRGFGKTIEKKA